MFWLFLSKNSLKYFSELPFQTKMKKKMFKKKLSVVEEKINIRHSSSNLCFLKMKWKKTFEKMICFLANKTLVWNSGQKNIDGWAYPDDETGLFKVYNHWNSHCYANFLPLIINKLRLKQPYRYVISCNT